MNFSKLPNFDPKQLRLVLRITATVCVGLLLLGIAILVIVSPDHSYCSGWRVPLKGGEFRSIWSTVAISAVLTFLMCVFALNWEKVARSIISRANKEPFEALVLKNQSLDLRTLPYDRIFICLGGGWSYAVAQPLFDMLENCALVKEGQPFWAPANVLDLSILIIGAGFIIFYIGRER